MNDLYLMFIGTRNGKNVYDIYDHEDAKTRNKLMGRTELNPPYVYHPPEGSYKLPDDINDRIAGEWAEQ